MTLSILFSIIVFISILLMAGMMRLSAWMWLSLMTAWLMANIYFTVMPYTLVVILGSLFLIMAIWRYFTHLRQRWFTKPFLTFFKKMLPPISVTEQEALEAGGTYWETDLMRGLPDWKKLQKMPTGKLTEEEKSFLENQTETLCGMINEWETLCTQNLPQSAWDYIKQEKFWGLIIPKEYGGLGFSTLAHSSIIAKIATRNVAAAVTVMVPNSLGPGELLLKYGNEEQKKYYLPRLAKGQEVPCFGLTELMAGSDANGMEAQGVICRGQHEGKEIVGIRLNWAKRYITLAPIATIIGVAFKLYDPDHLLGNKKDLGITLALIPVKHAGISMGERHMPLLTGFMNGPTQGRDVFIPLEWIIGGQEHIGQGWRMLMECLAAGRGISLPAMGSASATLCYRLSGAYAALRQQFNLAIGRFPGVQEALGRIGGLTYFIEATRLLTVTGIDQQYHSAIASAITKYFLTEFSRIVVDDAMDIHGGRGIILGPRNYLVFTYLSNPIGITVEGANILTRNLMIFGQGAIRCHPYIVPEMKAAALVDEQQALQQFDSLLVKHIAYAASNLIRLRATEVLSWWHRHFTSENKVIKRYQAQLTRMSSALAFITDLMFLILGGELKRDETISARLADVLGHLYMSSAVLHYFEKNSSPVSDIPYVKWCFKYSLYHMQCAFVGVANNFPKKKWRWLIRRLCFPFTLPYRPPSDALAHQIAESMQSSSDLRDRLTHLMFINDKSNDAIGRIELAFKKLLLAKPALKKIHDAQHEKKISRDLSWEEKLKMAQQLEIIGSHEITLLQDYNQAYRDALAVDAFSAEEVESWFR